MNKYCNKVDLDNNLWDVTCNYAIYRCTDANCSCCDHLNGLIGFYQNIIQLCGKWGYTCVTTTCMWEVRLYLCYNYMCVGSEAILVLQLHVCGKWRNYGGSEVIPNMVAVYSYSKCETWVKNVSVYYYVVNETIVKLYDIQCIQWYNCIMSDSNSINSKVIYLCITGIRSSTACFSIRITWSEFGK